MAALTGDHVAAPPDFEPTGETLELPADLVLIAIGFTGRGAPVLEALGVEDRPRDRHRRLRDERRRRVRRRDARRGQSLIVTAIAEGRGCSRAVERYLTSA